MKSVKHTNISVKLRKIVLNRMVLVYILVPEVKLNLNITLNFLKVSRFLYNTMLSCSELTEDDIKECIEWLLEEVDIVYRFDCKIRKKLGSIFDSIETADELKMLRNIFEELASMW